MKLLSEGHVACSDLHYLEILGHGSGGTVYRTFHQPSKIVMAVKVLALDVTAEEQKQIKAELEILHKVGVELGGWSLGMLGDAICVCTVQLPVHYRILWSILQRGSDLHLHRVHGW